MKTLLVVLFFAGLILISPVLPRSVAAAAFPVTKVEDTADGACDSDCSLREAIIASNTLPGSDTIEVPAGTYLLSVTGRYEDAGATGDLDITDDLTITGAGPDLTIVDGSDLDRIVHVVGPHTVHISSVALRNGNTRADAFTGDQGDRGGSISNAGGTLGLSNSVITSNLSEGDGGGIVSEGSLTLTASVVSNNDAGDGSSGFGGGIHTNGIALIMNSVINSNSANDGGGVLVIGTATISQTTLSGNHSELIGGAIDNFGTAILMETTIDGNSALAGGGIGNQESTLAISNSTISNNVADIGGGVASGGQATLTNVTISGNQAAADGGGISYPGSILSGMHLTNATISGNSADADRDGLSVSNGDLGDLFSLKNTIVAGNVDTTGEAPDCTGNPVSNGYNLVQDLTGCSLGGDTIGNITGHDPLLGPLSVNGSTTSTHALLSGSPAIDTGSSDCPPPATDQRGILRPVDGNGDGIAVCDIGAFESQPVITTSQLKEAVTALPATAFKTGGNGVRAAMLSILGDVDQALASGDTADAIDLLRNLRLRVDGCGSARDRNDWVIECTAQAQLRALIDALIDSLGG